MTDDIKNRLHQFFPGESFPADKIESALEKGDILTTKEAILPFLQTALFDDKVLEIELDSLPRTYFSGLKDGLPDINGGEEDAVLLEEDEYSKAII